MPDTATTHVHQDVSPVCLDFANTMDWHASEHPEETLHSYVDLVSWAQRVQLVSASAARRLHQVAIEQPAEARQALVRAIVLREAVYRIFVALSHATSPAEADLARLNSALANISRGARLRQTAAGFAWQWDIDEQGLDVVLQRVALSAAELLISEQRERVGQCADDRGCGWLFLDLSKNRSRRWCDIRDCGNRAKQRRHYAKTRRPVRPA